MIKIMGGSL